jgi:uncharacterized membrane protein
MLYYFNLVQTPFFGTELGGQARGPMMRGLVPTALWWFRWGAMFTFLSGWTLVIVKMMSGGSSPPYYTLILTGGLIGTIMWANVWFVIWPIQKIAIASADAVAKGGQADPAAAAKAPIAARASRTNVVFSFPMLFFMASASHLTQIVSGEPVYSLYWLGVLVLLAAIAANPFYGNATTQKLLGTVKGAIHLGATLALVLYLWADILL